MGYYPWYVLTQNTAGCTTSFSHCFYIQMVGQAGEDKIPDHTHCLCVLQWQTTTPGHTKDWIPSKSLSSLVTCAILLLCTWQPLELLPPTPEPRTRPHPHDHTHKLDLMPRAGRECEHTSILKFFWYPFFYNPSVHTRGSPQHITECTSCCIQNCWHRQTNEI